MFLFKSDSEDSPKTFLTPVGDFWKCIKAQLLPRDCTERTGLSDPFLLPFQTGSTDTFSSLSRLVKNSSVSKTDVLNVHNSSFFGVLAVFLESRVPDFRAVNRNRSSITMHRYPNHNLVLQPDPVRGDDHVRSLFGSGTKAVKKIFKIKCQ